MSIQLTIPFNRPTVFEDSYFHLEAILKGSKFSADGPYAKKCVDLLEKKFGVRRAYLTPSCTAALEMAALLADISVGDEVIMPSFTFVSSANAFVLKGATIVFVDVDPDTMNLDVNQFKLAITSKTKAVVPVHYAGVGCEMDEVLSIAKEYNLMIIEDAAQALNSKYRGTYLGSIGTMGCTSFHDTKNYHCGEGGALFINDTEFIERVEIIREKGTNRNKFFRGEVDKYTWMDVGSSYLINEFTCAVLFSQLNRIEEITEIRIRSWQHYHERLTPLQDEGKLSLLKVPDHCQQNAHIFAIKLESLEQRSSLIEFLLQRGVQSTFHYVPLHSSPAGERYGRFAGQDAITTKDASRLLRLPLFYGLSKQEIDYVCDNIRQFFT
jgi:dTDP-4-amino-4,6-dideoxygalactose transaminase